MRPDSDAGASERGREQVGGSDGVGELGASNGSQTCEGGGVVVDADADPAVVGGEVVNAEGDGLAEVCDGVFAHFGLMPVH